MNAYKNSMKKIMCFWIKRRFREVGGISWVFTLKLWNPLIS